MTTVCAVPPRSTDGPAPSVVPLTRFIGRTEEVAALRRQLDDTRLLSLVGPGGSGKTRLARAVRDQVGVADPQNCWWVPLAQIGPPTSVVAAVADALRVAEVPGRRLVATLLSHLAERTGLLILDNCEHLVVECAVLVGQLLHGCPGLRIMTTSREPLAVAGETTWWVDGLTLPPDDPAPRVADLAASEAVQLVADRARLVQPSFAVTEANAAAVARLCRRLDGMPLALELAAARLRMLPLQRIVDRLDDACSLLVTAHRDVPPRQATLRATLDWSHNLLPERERDLFARLSVFRGGFTLDAAEAVVGDRDGGLDTLDLLARLVDKSLVQVHTGEHDERYRLLEVVRQYAAERLGDRGDAAARHARHLLDLVERAELGLRGAGQELWLDRLHREQDNLRAALAWARQHEPSLGVRLAGGLGRYYRMRGQYGEGRERLHAAVTAADGHASPAALAKALAYLGRLEYLQCEYGFATARLRRALELYTGLDDQPGIASTVQSLGSIAREQGHYDAARRHYDECLMLWQRLDEPAGVARALKFLALTSWLEGDHPRAAELAADALRRFRDVGDDEGVVGALVDVAAARHRQGDPHGAWPVLQESLALSRRLGYREGIAWSTEQLGVVAATLGERATAVTLLSEGLAVHHELGDRWRTACTLDALAGVLADARIAARLLAAAEQTRQDIGTPVPSCDREQHDRRVQAVHAALSPQDLALASAEGRALPLDRAVAVALAAVEEQPADPPPADPPRAEPPPADPLRAELARAEPAPVGVSGAPPVFVLNVVAGLRVRALGRIRVQVDGRELGPEDWTYAKPRELLYHLLTRPGSTKAEIGLAVWPEASGVELRNSFHTCLKYLRRALGGPHLVRHEQGRYHVDGGPGFFYDVAAFRSAVAQAWSLGAVEQAIPVLAAAAELYPGDFLVDLPGADWAEWPRERLRSQYEQVLLRLGDLLARQRRLPEAVETFARLVEHDPTLEVAHRGLMRCHAAMGNRARALRQYEDLVVLLDSALGAAPDAETTRLYRSLRSTATTAAAAAA